MKKVICYCDRCGEEFKEGQIHPVWVDIGNLRDYTYLSKQVNFAGVARFEIGDLCDGCITLFLEELSNYVKKISPKTERGKK